MMVMMVMMVMMMIERMMMMMMIHCSTLHFPPHSLVRDHSFVDYGHSMLAQPIFVLLLLL